MVRQSKIVNMSLPPEILKRVGELARKKGVSRSEILREALKQYIISERLWQQIYKWGEESAKRLGIKDERDVDKLIEQFRKEQSQK